MDTRIEKRVGIQASAERLWDILSDFNGWSRWNPYETDLEGQLAFGAPLRLTETWPDMAPRQVEGRINEWQPLAQLPELHKLVVHTQARLLCVPDYVDGPRLEHRCASTERWPPKREACTQTLQH